MMMSEQEDRPGTRMPVRREDLQGTWAMEAQEYLEGPEERDREEELREFGLEAAESIRDRKLTLFARGRRTSTDAFLSTPFLEDARDLDSQHVAFLGAPYDGGTTYRPGTRFGPSALRKMSSEVGSPYNPGLGVNLKSSLDMVDLGDIRVIPSNLEKSFDQIAKAVSYVAEREVFPVVLGGDHAIGYPDVRGLSPYVDGNIGIIHLDRHSDISEYSIDERMHGSPFFHATNIPNAPPTNLVQVGIGGWSGGRDGLRETRDRNATVITVDDVDRYGVDRIIEYALEIAWHNADAVWLSFDIDVVDPAYAPGTGTPVAGGLTPREILRMLRGFAAEGLVGMEIVEVSPPYDHADITALLGAHSIMEVLGSMVVNGKLGRRPETPEKPY
ncbi:MAG: agmatinase family protein [Thermomicrobiales bacterium]